MSEPWKWRRDRADRCVAWVTDTVDVWGRVIKSNGRFYWGVWALASTADPGQFARRLGRGVAANFDEACAAAEAARDCRAVGSA